MRRVAIVIIALIGIASSGLIWLPTAAKIADGLRRVREPIHGPYVPLHESGTTTWAISRNDWWFHEGEAHLELQLETPKNYSEGPLQKENLNVVVKINAYGITEDNNKYNRLIRNWYFNTDEPLSSDNHLWSGASSFGLGGVIIYPGEKTVVEVSVLKPNPALKFTKPRLVMAAQYDHAAVPYAMLLRVGGYIVFGCSILSLLLLSFLAWRSPRLER